MRPGVLVVLVLWLFLGTLAVRVLARASHDLDGQRFDVMLVEQGKPGGVSVRLSFDHGRLGNSAYRSRKIPDASYRTGKGGFEARFPEVNGGSARWTGRVKGDIIQGSIAFERKGEPVLTFEFTGQRIGSLYQRLGGEKAVSAVVDTFVDRFLADPELNANPVVDAARRKTDPERLKYGLVNFLGQAAGGPEKYGGRTMKEVHAQMAIGEKEWKRIVVLLVDVLNQYKVPRDEQDDLLGLVGSTKGDIVTVK